MRKIVSDIIDRTNVLLCCICLGISLYRKDWGAAGGWLCAALAWQQSNFHRVWMERWESISKTAIDASSSLIATLRKAACKKDEKEPEEAER